VRTRRRPSGDAALLTFDPGDRSPSGDLKHDVKGVPDLCDIALGAADRDLDGVPDSCEFAAGGDCDVDGTFDDCEILAGAPDCNQNGELDECDIASGSSPDADMDGIPDECQLPEFRRGDANVDGQQNIADAVTMLDALFGGAAVICQTSHDANGDGAVNIADPIRLLGYTSSRASPPSASPSPAAATNVRAVRGLSVRRVVHAA
jgi:hypothetical protein